MTHLTFNAAIGRIETITFRGTSGDDSVSATFSIARKSRGKVVVTANIHADHGRIFGLESCRGGRKGGMCNVFIEDDMEPEETLHSDVVDQLIDQSRTVGHGECLRCRSR